MENPNQFEGTFFAADIDPGELHLILDRIDESLAFYQVVHDTNDFMIDDNVLIPDLPLFQNMVTLSDHLKMSTAPLQPSMGVGGIRGFVLRMINLPIRLFGEMEIEFNRSLREFIGELVAFNHAVNAQTTALNSAVASLDRKLGGKTGLEMKVQELDAANISYQDEIKLLQEHLETLRQDLVNAINRLEKLEQDQNKGQ